MISKTINNLNLKQIAESGQCFRWKQIEEKRYSVVAFGKYLEISQNGNQFDFSCEEDDWEQFWKDYFDTDTDYDGIRELIMSSEDAHLKEAFEGGSGVRILRQDLWEIIVSFMISQNNNIKRISSSVDLICQRFGRPIELDNQVIGYTFPRPGEVNPELFIDKTLGLGYRDLYLKEIYEFAQANPKWLEELKGLDYEAAMASLLERKGIGKKVANCICLFGLHHVDAFPIDTHVKQLLEKYYKEGFDFERYEGVAGIIQQYLFYYEINNS